MLVDNQVYCLHLNVIVILNLFSPCGRLFNIMQNNKNKIILGVLVLLVAIGVVYGMYLFKNSVFSANNSQADKDLELVDLTQQLNMNNFDEATKIAENVSNRDSKDVNNLVLLASVYANRGSAEFKEKEYGEKALQTIKKALALDPRNSDAYRVQGYAYEIMSLWAQSISSYNKSIEIDPKNARAFVNRGHVYNLLGNLDTAEEDYRGALKIDPNEGDALFNLGRISFSNNKKTEARAFLNRALENTSAAFRKADIYQVLAVVALAEENFSEARTNVNQSIELNGQSATAYVTRGEISRAELAVKMFKNDKIPDFQVRVDSIVADASKATSININQTGAMVLVAKLSVLLGEYDQALKVYEKALSMIDADITLGAKEKNATRDEINKSIKIVKDNTK